MIMGQEADSGDLALAPLQPLAPLQGVLPSFRSFVNARNLAGNGPAGGPAQVEPNQAQAAAPLTAAAPQAAVAPAEQPAPINNEQLAQVQPVITP